MIRVACLVGSGEEWLWRKYCYWCQATTAMRMVAETRPFTLHNDVGQDWVQLFPSYFAWSWIVWWWKVNVAWRVSTKMIHNAYVSIGTLIFYFISNSKQFFLFLIWCYLLHRLWLLQTSCSIFIDVACYNHSRVFYACCTISMHITVILVVMLKSAILLPKNSMCPILPLNKNYLRNYLETKNYLEVPEWQDDSWSGNCSTSTGFHEEWNR